MATLPNLDKTVTKDPSPPAADTALTPVSRPVDGTTVLTTLVLNKTIDNVNEIIDYISGDNGAGTIPQSAITSLTTDLAAKLPLAGGTMSGSIINPDNIKVLFGTGSDASIYYDGVDLNINSAEVGTGDIVFHQDTRLPLNRKMIFDSGNNLAFVQSTVNGTLGLYGTAGQSLTIQEDGDVKANVGDFILVTGQYLWFDNKGNTGIRENGADNIEITAGGTIMANITDIGVTGWDFNVNDLWHLGDVYIEWDKTLYFSGVDAKSSDDYIRHTSSSLRFGSGGDEPVMIDGSGQGRIVMRTGARIEWNDIAEVKKGQMSVTTANTDFVAYGGNQFRILTEDTGASLINRLIVDGNLDATVATFGDGGAGEQVSVRINSGTGEDSLLQFYESDSAKASIYYDPNDNVLKIDEVSDTSAIQLVDLDLDLNGNRITLDAAGTSYFQNSTDNDISLFINSALALNVDTVHFNVTNREFEVSNNTVAPEINLDSDIAAFIGTIGVINFLANDLGGADTMGRIFMSTSDITAGASDADMFFQANSNGALTNMMFLDGSIPRVYSYEDLWAAKDFILSDGGKLLLDGSGSGDTYFTQGAANVIYAYAGGTNILRLSSTQVKIQASTLAMTQNERIDLDDDQDTSIRASIDDVIDVEIAATDVLQITANGIIDYKGTMGSSTVDPSTHGAPDDWIEVKIGGIAHYVPAYLAT